MITICYYTFVIFIGLFINEIIPKPNTNTQEVIMILVGFFILAIMFRKFLKFLYWNFDPKNYKLDDIVSQ